MRILLLFHAVLLCSPVYVVNGQDIPYCPPPTPVLFDQIQVCRHVVLAKESRLSQRGNRFWIP